MTPEARALQEAVKDALTEVLAKGGWKEIRARHRRVGLPWREDLKPGWGKPSYVRAVLDELPASTVMEVAEATIACFPSECLALQDALWHYEDEGRVAISAVTRDALADALDGRRLHPTAEPSEFLARFAAATPEPLIEFSYQGDGTLQRRRDDPFSDETVEMVGHRELLVAHGFYEWPDRRLFGFLEALVAPTTRQGEEQHTFVTVLNEHLRRDGFALKETDQLSGHAVYRVRPYVGGVAGTAKNLVFASTGPKPELGFVDAINNDVQILKHGEHSLIYSDPIDDEGLPWNVLLKWWANQRGQDPADPKVRKELGSRLRKAVASPPEENLFSAYYRLGFDKLGGRLPALLPQVYLHYDPRTVRELHARGEDKRFLAQRMDFLLLLPYRVRVVLEVDGQQHYSEERAGSIVPSPRVYADTVAGDRALRLAGYEVYRFGGYELHTEVRAKAVVQAFLDAILRKHQLDQSVSK